MPEHVWIHPFANPCMLCIAMKAFPGPLGVQSYGIFPLRHKECRMIIMPDLQILLDPDESRFREIDFARFVPLPNNLGRLRFPINLGAIERECFSNTHARDTEDFGQCSVT